MCKGDDRLLIRLTEDATNPLEDFLGRNPSRSLVFKQNSGVVQFGADIEIAVQVKSDEKLRVRRRGGKNLHKDPKRNVSVKGASVFCFNEPKCFRLRIRENHRQGKQQSEQKSSDQEIVYLKIQKDNGTEIHVEQVKNSGKENRRARKGDRSKKRKRNRICPSLEFDEPGSYKLLVEKGKEVIFWDFKIQPKDEQYATDIRRPIRTFADGKTSLASVTKICSNQTQTTNEENSTIKTKSKRRLKKVKAATYQWRSDIEIEADIDLVDSAQLELPKNSLQGGKTYIITSNVVIEAQDKSLVKAEASIPLTVELKGVKAAIMPTELTVGLGGKGHLSGRLSEDLDNTDTPWVFDWYCTTLDGGSCPVFKIPDKNEVKGRGKETSSIPPTLTTLEAVIDKENLRKAELIIDGDLLLPGEYIFTLAAAKGTQRSEANATFTNDPGFDFR